MEKHQGQSFNNFIESSSEVLLNFIYDTIEKGRRRALREMLSLCEAAMKGNADKVTRERILRYLETTYSEEIEKVLNETTSFDYLKKLIDGHVETHTGEMIGGIRSPRDAAEIRGQVARYLESYPDQPGLLFLRGISELFCRGFDLEIVMQNLRTAIEFAQERYSIPNEILFDIIAWFLVKIYYRDERIHSYVLEDLLYEIDNELLASIIITHEESTNQMIIKPAIFLLKKLSDRAIRIFEEG